MKYITRIAPSPTGIFHIGTARTALFNYLAARSSDGRFILRIDDTDVARNKPEYTNTIINTIRWLGLEYDACFAQSDRLSRYHHMANNLLCAGLARTHNGAIFFNPTAAISSINN